MSLTQCIHRGKHLYGDKPALVFGERSTSYRDLYDEVSRCASAFVAIDGGARLSLGLKDSQSPCPADLTGDDQVNIDDIFAVLGLWGACPDPCPPYCAGDLTEDCTVNIDDIFAILGMWGPCV